MQFVEQGVAQRGVRSRNLSAFLARELERLPFDQPQQPVRAGQGKIFLRESPADDEDRRAQRNILDCDAHDLMERIAAARVLKVVQYHDGRSVQAREEFAKEAARETRRIGQVFRGQQRERPQLARPSG